MSRIAATGTVDDGHGVHRAGRPLPGRRRPGWSCRSPACSRCATGGSRCGATTSTWHVHPRRRTRSADSHRRRLPDRRAPPAYGDRAAGDRCRAAGPLRGGRRRDQRAARRPTPGAPGRRRRRRCRGHTWSIVGAAWCAHVGGGGTASGPSHVHGIRRRDVRARAARRRRAAAARGDARGHPVGRPQRRLRRRLPPPGRSPRGRHLALDEPAVHAAPVTPARLRSGSCRTASATSPRATASLSCTPHDALADAEATAAILPHLLRRAALGPDEPVDGRDTAADLAPEPARSACSGTRRAGAATPGGRGRSTGAPPGGRRPRSPRPRAPATWRRTRPGGRCGSKRWATDTMIGSCTRYRLKLRPPRRCSAPVSNSRRDAAEVHRGEHDDARPEHDDELLEPGERLLHGMDACTSCTGFDPPPHRQHQPTRATSAATPSTPSGTRSPPALDPCADRLRVERGERAEQEHRQVEQHAARLVDAQRDARRQRGADERRLAPDHQRHARARRSGSERGEQHLPAQRPQHAVELQPGVGHQRRQRAADRTRPRRSRASAASRRCSPGGAGGSRACCAVARTIAAAAGT